MKAKMSEYDLYERAYEIQPIRTEEGLTWFWTIYEFRVVPPEDSPGAVIARGVQQYYDNAFQIVKHYLDYGDVTDGR